jgi:hypothetical protein
MSEKELVTLEVEKNKPLNIKGFQIEELLRLNPKDYYLKKSFLMQSGSDWMCVPFKTDFEQLVLISDSNTGNNFKTTTKLGVRSVTIEKVYDLLYTRFEVNKVNLELRLVGKVLDFLKIDNSFGLDSYILNHFKNGIILGKNKFVPNIQLMLEDLSVYLSNLPEEENLELINQCNLLIYFIRNVFDQNSFVLKPAFLSSKESRKYQKLLASLSKILINNRFNSSMMEYCLIIRNVYISKDKKYRDLFGDFFRFFVSLSIELNSSYNKTNFFRNVMKEEKFHDLDILYLNNEVRLTRDVTLITFILSDIEFEGTKFELPYWKNRLFGKGYKLLLSNEFAVDGEGNQPNPKYDIVNFTKEFNKMIDQRMALNQKFHN